MVLELGVTVLKGLAFIGIVWCIICIGLLIIDFKEYMTNGTIDEVEKQWRDAIEEENRRAVQQNRETRTRERRVSKSNTSTTKKEYKITK